MPWWLDAVLLVSAALLWFSGSADRDDVWGLLLKMLAGIALLVVLLGGRQILLEGLVLALALWLPSASSSRLRRCQHSLRRLLGRRRRRAASSDLRRQPCDGGGRLSRPRFLAREKPEDGIRNIQTETVL
jgi:hypothetical protein